MRVNLAPSLQIIPYFNVEKKQKIQLGYGKWGDSHIIAGFNPSIFPIIG